MFVGDFFSQKLARTVPTEAVTFEHNFYNLKPDRQMCDKSDFLQW